MMMASAKLVRDCSSELSSDVRSLSVASSIEEQDSTTTDSEYTEEEKEYELDDLQMLKTIGEYINLRFSILFCVYFELKRRVRGELRLVTNIQFLKIKFDWSTGEMRQLQK